MNSTQSALRFGTVAVTLVRKDLRQNFLTYLLPLPFFVASVVYRIIRGYPIRLNAELSIALLVAAAIIAIVYGLQGFSGEADRKNLDFLLARPVHPWVLAVSKYLLNMGIFAFWLLMFQTNLDLNLSLLPIAEDAAGGWAVLTLSVLVGMSFVSGLLLRGTERLVAAVLLSSLLAGLSYAVWLGALTLLTARYYWPDIPPHLLSLVCRYLPAVLLLGALIVPPVFAHWLLKGRRSLWRYRPVRWVASLWIALFLLVQVARAALGPAIWPVQELSLLGGACGDWHLRSGVVLAGTPFRHQPYMPYLLKASLGGRARPVYRGVRVSSPRWSPDGRAVAFGDDGWIKVLRGRSVQRLARGEDPFWSRDGRMLAYFLPASDRNRRAGIGFVNQSTGKTGVLWRKDSDSLGFVWDSARRRLYLFDRAGSIRDIDLRTGKTLSLRNPTEMKLSVQNPWGVLGPQGRLYLSLCSDNEVCFYVHEPGTEDLAKVEKVAGHLLSVSQAIVAPDGRGFLWPRLDGAYEYQGFLPDEEEHEHGQEHAHEHED